MNYHKAVSKNIKKYCRTRKISYSELARRAGVPLRTLQNILYISAKEPHLSTVHLIAKVLKISIDGLLK